jgi:TAT (twin-arginine translocation) pathway-exported protein
MTTSGATITGRPLYPTRRMRDCGHCCSPCRPICSPVHLSREKYLVKPTYSRRTFLQTSAVAGAVLATDPHLVAATPAAAATKLPARPTFPVADYHVHLSLTLSIEQALQLGKERQVQIGILEHPGPGYPINTDADLRHYIDGLRKHPVRIGLQPVYPGWSRSFSKSLLDELDYTLMDAITLPNPDGSSWALWQIDTHVDDEDAFMTRYMQFIEQVLTTEPIDIFGWPTFLPVPIARQYSQLWTRPLVDRIIELAKAKKIAIEINEVAHIPDETFIMRAKRAGLKFTFGSDSRNQNAAHFYYCYQMAQKCDLQEEDMWTPNRRPIT